MTITATPIDVPAGGSSTAVTLCDGDTRAAGKWTGPDSLAGALEPGAVTRRFAGDEGIAEEAAGNAEGSLSFGVLATFATPALAQAAAAGLKAAVPKVASIAVDSATHFDRASIRYSWAVVGCSVAVKYQIRGY